MKHNAAEWVNRNRKICITAGILILALIVTSIMLIHPALRNTEEAKDTVPQYVVYIETGHGIDYEGKWDAGAKWKDGETKYEEAKLMIPIAQSMADYLQQSGVKVYTDAYDENNKNLKWTLEFLKQHRVDAFVNIHCDYKKAESGTMPLYRTEEQKQLADALNKGVHSVVDMPDRGLTKEDKLDTLNSEIHCPAVLYETGSIKADNELLRTRGADIGKGLAIGMCRYLGIDFIDN